MTIAEPTNESMERSRKILAAITYSHLILYVCYLLSTLFAVVDWSSVDTIIIKYNNYLVSICAAYIFSLPAAFYFTFKYISFFTEIPDNYKKAFTFWDIFVPVANMVFMYKMLSSLFSLSGLKSKISQLVVFICSFQALLSYASLINIIGRIDLYKSLGEPVMDFLGNLFGAFNLISCLCCLYIVTRILRFIKSKESTQLR